MKNWLTTRSTTNFLLVLLCMLLGLHIVLNIPIVPVAKAQVLTTDETDYMKSIDKKMDDINSSVDSIAVQLRIIQSCIVTTPSGGKALQTKNLN